MRVINNEAAYDGDFNDSVYDDGLDNDSDNEKRWHVSRPQTGLPIKVCISGHDVCGG